MEIVQIQEEPSMVIMALNLIVEAAARDQDLGARGQAKRDPESGSKRKQASIQSSDAYGLMLPSEGASLSRLMDFLQATELYRRKNEVSHD